MWNRLRGSRAATRRDKRHWCNPKKTRVYLKRATRALTHQFQCWRPVIKQCSLKKSSSYAAIITFELINRLMLRHQIIMKVQTVAFALVGASVGAAAVSIIFKALPLHVSIIALF